MSECWMQTYTGGVFYPLDPDPGSIRVEDIAGALSKTCRFNGHCLRFYSVAEHCLHIAERAPDHLKLTALLHDASEAYLGDVIRPLKPRLTNYAEIEDRLMTIIAKKFRFPWPSEEIKKLDTAILGDERQQIMAKTDIAAAAWGNPLPPLGVTIACWSPAEANQRFLDAFYFYGGRAQ